MKIQSKKVLNDDFVSFFVNCVLTKSKHERLLLSCKVVSEVLKRLQNICGHFGKCFEVFRKSSEVTGMFPQIPVMTR